VALEDYLSGDQRNAYEALNQQFNEYGLGTLAPKIFDFIQKGYNADTISLLLQDTPEFKQRFAGNEDRRKAGLPVLSPAEYLSTESSYRQIMQQAGLPPGFYDQPSDFRNFIGKDVSPTEIKQRTDLAVQNSTLANSATKEALKRMYGIDENGIAAYFLDPERAAPLLQKQAAAAAIGGEALKRGLALSQNLEEYAGAGVTASQAAQAYTQIATNLPAYQQIAHQYGSEFTQSQYEHALLEPGTTGLTGLQPGGGREQVTGVENPTAELERLASWNRANAQGQVGAGRGGIGRSASGQV
jgi:hypothetical protein